MANNNNAAPPLVEVHCHHHLVLPALSSRHFDVNDEGGQLYSGVVFSFHSRNKRPLPPVVVDVGDGCALLVRISCKEGTFRNEERISDHSGELCIHSGSGPPWEGHISAVVNNALSARSKRAGSVPNGRWLGTKHDELCVRLEQTYLLSCRRPFHVTFRSDNQPLSVFNNPERSTGVNGVALFPLQSISSISTTSAACAQLSSPSFHLSSAFQQPLHHQANHVDEIHKLNTASWQDDTKQTGDLFNAVHSSSDYDSVEGKDCVLPAVRTMSNASHPLLFLDQPSLTSTPPPFPFGAPSSPPAPSAMPTCQLGTAQHHVLELDHCFVLVLPKPAQQPSRERDDEFKWVIAQLQQAWTQPHRL